MGDANMPAGDIPDTYDLMRELALLDPAGVRLFLDDFDQLYLRHVGGEAGASQTTEPVGPLQVQRAFPVSEAGEFLSLKEVAGDEVGLIRRLADLDADSRAALEHELKWTYFRSVISAVHSVEVQFHVPHWDVETDRGRRVFELHSSRRDIRVLPGGRVLLRDADGNVYEIPDMRRLDPASRAIVEDYV